MYLYTYDRKVIFIFPLFIKTWATMTIVSNTASLTDLVMSLYSKTFRAKQQVFFMIELIELKDSMVDWIHFLLRLKWP